MLEDLLFCLNATLPIFLLMVLGYIFRITNIFSETFAKELNSFTFKIALPTLVFKELATSEVEELWDTGFIVFCFLATLGSILIGFVIALIFRAKSIRPEFIQGSYRSSAALLGVGIATNIYGNAGMTPLMIIGAVPLYNIAAVIILTVGQGEGKITGALIKKTLCGVITNPIIIGVFLGIIRGLISYPLIFPKTINAISALATPMGLMALGASFEMKKAVSKLGPTLTATFFKLVGFTAIWLPIAIMLGYTQDRLIAVLIMTGSPTTVSSFVMAKSMGYEGTTSAGIVMLTTILSAFTLTLWLYILKANALI